MRVTECRQDRFRKSELATPEVQGLPLPVGQNPLDCRRNAVADLFPVPKPLDQPAVPKNAEMMRGMRL